MHSNIFRISIRSHQHTLNVENGKNRQREKFGNAASALRSSSQWLSHSHSGHDWDRLCTKHLSRPPSVMVSSMDSSGTVIPLSLSIPCRGGGEPAQIRADGPLPPLILPSLPRADPFWPSPPPSCHHLAATFLVRGFEPMTSTQGVQVPPSAFGSPQQGQCPSRKDVAY